MDLLFLDTETGGTNPDQHSLLQVGLVAYVGGKIAGKAGWYVKEREYRVTPEAMRINKLDLTEVSEKGLEPAELTERIIRFVQAHFVKVPMVAGHNVMKLDYPMVQHLFERVGKSFEAITLHRAVDTMTLLYVLYQLGKIPASALSSYGAFEHFGITPSRPHDAVEDALTTVNLYEICLDLLRGRLD